MKFIWIFSILFAFILIQVYAKGGSKSAAYAKAKNDCLKSNNITSNEYKAAKKNKFANATKPMQCYIDCVSNALGTMKDGEVQDEVANKVLKKATGSSTTAANIVKTCKAQVTGADNCAKSYSFRICCLNAIPSGTTDSSEN